MATVQNLPRNPPASWPIVLLALLALAGALGLDLYAGYKRVAAQEPAACQPQAGQQAVPLERFDRVVRAGRMKTAAAAGAEEQRQHR